LQQLQEKQLYGRRTRVAGHPHERSTDNVPFGMRFSGDNDGYRNSMYGRPGTAPQQQQQQHQDLGDAFVLPDISNGSPLLSGFEFAASRESIYQQMQQSGASTRRLSRRSATNNNDNNNIDDDIILDGNSPRRSRSLRNTITSLRRKLSRSSRNGGAQTQQQQQQQYRNSSSSPDFAPMDKAVATSAVVDDLAAAQNGL
ncbi:hypothetical protein LPJ57_002701, partial [Coemansia sp. RSA 486]